jgi:hypothetical protein
MVFLSVKAVIPTQRRPDTTSKSDRNVYSNDEYADREDEAVVRRTGDDKKEKRTRSCNPPTVQLRAQARRLQYIILKIAVVLQGRTLHGLFSCVAARELRKISCSASNNYSPSSLAGFPISSSTRPSAANMEIILLLLRKSYQSTLPNMLSLLDCPAPDLGYFWPTVSDGRLTTMRPASRLKFSN